MGKRDPRVDAYIEKAQPFAKPILKGIRKAVHAGCPGVQETIKWGMPQFDYKGPICGMAGFKAHCALGFWKGSLLGIGGMGDSDAMGQFGRITSLNDLPSEKKLIALVKKAAKLNEDGVKVERKAKRAPRSRTVRVPDDLLAAFDTKRKARAAFEAFSPSHKREYVEWITGAKQKATRERRIATALEWLSEGKSLNWKYR